MHKEKNMTQGEALDKAIDDLKKQIEENQKLREKVKDLKRHNSLLVHQHNERTLYLLERRQQFSILWGLFKWIKT